MSHEYGSLLDPGEILDIRFNAADTKTMQAMTYAALMQIAAQLSVIRQIAEAEHDQAIIARIQKRRTP